MVEERKETAEERRLREQCEQTAQVLAQAVGGGDSSQGQLLAALFQAAAGSNGDKGNILEQLGNAMGDLPPELLQSLIAAGNQSQAGKSKSGAKAKPKVSPKARGAAAAASTKPKKPAVSPKRSSAAAATKPKAVVQSQPGKKKMPFAYQDAAARTKEGFGAPDFSKTDKIMDYMLKNRERLETPKMVVTSDDWLASHKESGQPIKRYQQGGPNINWLNKFSNKILLFVIDDTINQDTQQKLLKICTAFYTGCQVELVTPGSVIKKDGRNCTLPTDFLGKHNIATRENYWTGGNQLHAGQILNALKEYKARDTFGILAITNQDLYPHDDYNFVFGLACLGSGCGVFSFNRHQASAEAEGISEEEAHQLWLKRSAHTMVHEIGHIFGLKHCVTYECTMNGSNGSFESARQVDDTMCAYCLCKLKINIKFDCRDRFSKLVEAYTEVGFSGLAAKYAKILADVPP